MDSTLLENASTGNSPAPLPLKIHAEDRGLQRRYTEGRAAAPVSFEFTRDPGLLHQYYILREKMFISVWGLKEFQGGQDPYDDISDILIARQGNLCVGGTRLTYSSPEHPTLLPIEDEQFQLKKVFPELDLENRIYAESTRMAILPEFRNNDIPYQLRAEIVQQYLRKKVSYGFWISPLPMARRHRQICLSLGFPCNIRRDVDLPEKEDYQGLKMYIGVMDFTSQLARNDETSPVVAEA